MNTYKKILVSNFLIASIYGFISGFSVLFGYHFLDSRLLNETEISLYKSYMNFLIFWIIPMAFFVSSYYFGKNIVINTNMKKIILTLFFSCFLGGCFGNLIGNGYYFNYINFDYLIGLMYVSIFNSVGSCTIFQFISFSAIIISNNFNK